MKTLPTPNEDPPNGWWHRVRLPFRMLLPLLVLLAGIGVAWALVATRPTAKKRPPRPLETLVDVQPVARTNVVVTVRATGTVIPAREITLKARVGGEIVAVSDQFVEGGRISKGEELLHLDPTDYELALARARAQRTTADYELKLELGQQKVASREWQLLNPGTEVSSEERDLALRKPHLARAQATYEAAVAEVKQAELDLERTVIRAPFNAIIRERQTELGAQVSTQDALASLVGTDAYWVQASLPTDRLSWIILPNEDGEGGAHVRIISGSDASEPIHTGRVIRLLSDVEEAGRMARLLIEIEDPLGLHAAQAPRTPLLLGSYVQLAIEGKRLDGVYRIPRSALHSNARIWVAGADDRLRVRPVEVVWRGPDSVLVRDGIEDGERLIVSGLAAPVQGMQLQVHGAIAADQQASTESPADEHADD